MISSKPSNKTDLSKTNTLVIVDWESFKRRCDYKHKSTSNEYCGTFGLTDKNNPIECSYEICPYIQMIVTEVKYDNKEKSTYIQ